MDCLSGRARRKIAQHGYDGLASSIELIHTKLLKHRQPTIYVNTAETEEAATISYVFVLWQAHLHRAERLMVSCGSAIDNNDPYGLAVLIRAFLEATAVVTSIRAKVQDWSENKITYENFDGMLMAALLGSKSEHLPNSPRAINILTHIKTADNYIDQYTPMTQQGPISMMYGVLSEYAHPNMSSNAVAFSIEYPGVFNFQHGAKITEKYIVLLGLLNTSAIIFDNISSSYHEILTGRLSENTGSVIQLRPVS